MDGSTPAVSPLPPIRSGSPRFISSIVGAAYCLDRRRLMAILIFTIIFAADLARPTDIDLWWHLKAGEIIANTGLVPAFDSFSYTAFGRPWVAHEWLWELGLYELMAVGGYRLAVLVSALIITATYVILYRLLRQLGANEFASATIVVWAAALALPAIGARRFPRYCPPTEAGIARFMEPSKTFL